MCATLVTVIPLVPQMVTGMELLLNKYLEDDIFKERDRNKKRG